MWARSDLVMSSEVGAIVCHLAVSIIATALTTPVERWDHVPI